MSSAFDVRGWSAGWLIEFGFPYVWKCREDNRNLRRLPFFFPFPFLFFPLLASYPFGKASVQWIHWEKSRNPLLIFRFRIENSVVEEMKRKKLGVQGVYMSFVHCCEEASLIWCQNPGNLSLLNCGTVKNAVVDLDFPGMRSCVIIHWREGEVFGVK